jgi:hypothetical protein
MPALSERIIPLHAFPCRLSRWSFRFTIGRMSNLVFLCCRVAGVAVLAVSSLCAQGLPRPEHPFPQMVRTEWLSLNGPWEFAETDDATEVYVNGKPIWKGDGWNDRYDGFDVTAALRAALEPGRNLIAIHGHQDDGGQYIDAALLVAGE